MEGAIRRWFKIGKVNGRIQSPLSIYHIAVLWGIAVYISITPVFIISKQVISEAIDFFFLFDSLLSLNICVFYENLFFRYNELITV